MKYICCLRTTPNHTGLKTVPLFLVKTFAEKEWIVFPSLLFISKGGGLAWITVPSHTVHEGRDVMGKKLEAGGHVVAIV